MAEDGERELWIYELHDGRVFESTPPIFTEPLPVRNSTGEMTGFECNIVQYFRRVA